MKELFKNFVTGVVFATAMMIGLATQQDVYAISSSELSQAPILTSGVIQTNSLKSGEDEQWYQFTVTSKGYFRVALSPNANANVDGINYGWEMTIYDQNNLNDGLKTYSSIKSSMVSAYMPMKPGKYCVKIQATNSYSSFSPIDVLFDIKVDIKSDASWESEYNNEKATTDVIKVNNTYNGTIYYGADEDWYKFTNKKAGYYNITLCPDETADIDCINYGWRVQIYKEDGTEIMENESICTNYTSPILPLEAGTYYLKITATNNYYSFSPIDQAYNLSMNFVETMYWEQEDNNSVETAGEIMASKKYFGNILYGPDEDWYKFTMTKTGKLNINFNKASSVDFDSIKYGWKIYVYNSAGEEKLCITDIKSEIKQGIKLEKGTYYIKITATNSYEAFAPLYCTYELKVNSKNVASASALDRPTVKVKVAKKKAKLSWKKISEAKGYVIYRSTAKNGNYKKIATIKKLKYTDKKVKKNKKYFYKVKAYTISNGKTTYSKASSVKFVKIK